MQRSEIAEKYKWDLTHIFKDEQAFLAAAESMRKEAPKISEFKGRLTNKAAVLECLQLDFNISKKLLWLDAYASMKKDENGSDANAQKNLSLIEPIITNYFEANSFIKTELLRLPEELFDDMIKDAAFKNFDYDLKCLKRAKTHILSNSEEELLSKTGAFAGDFSAIFNAFNSVDKVYGRIKIDGKSTRLTESLYAVLRENPNRAIRKKAFYLRADASKRLNNTLAANYIAALKKDWFFARVKKFKSCLESKLFYEQADPSIYKTLTAESRRRAVFAQEFYALKKRVLNLSELYEYDLTVPLCAAPAKQLSFEESYNLVVEALAPLGTEYQTTLRRALKERWIDVHENNFKRSGAYESCVLGAHPYVLLNYAPTITYTGTIAHEMGHAMHSVYSAAAQPEEKQGYTIMAAEVASTTNEILLSLYMADKYAAGNAELQKFFLSNMLDDFISTFYRQVRFATFEERAHALIEKDKPVTSQILNNLYAKITRDEYGGTVKSNPMTKYVWSYIPHFYSSYYVYKYATGIICAINFADAIYRGNKDALKRYEIFLSAGGSMSAAEALKQAGIDLSNSAPYDAAFKFLDNILQRLKKLF